MQEGATEAQIQNVIDRLVEWASMSTAQPA